MTPYLMGLLDDPRKRQALASSELGTTQAGGPPPLALTDVGFPTRQPAPMPTIPDAPPDPRIADASASLAIPKLSIWDRIRYATRNLPDAILNLPGGLSGSDRAYAIQQGLMRLGAGIAGGDPTQSIFSNIATALPQGQQGALEGIQVQDAMRDRARQAQLQRERERLFHEFRTDAGDDRSKTLRLLHGLSALAGMGDKVAASIAGPLSNVLAAQYQNEFIKLGGNNQLFRNMGPGEDPRLVATNKVTPPSALRFDTRIRPGADGEAHMYEYLVDPENPNGPRKEVDRGRAFPPGSAVSGERGTQDMRNAAMAGVKIKRNFDEIKTLGDDRDAREQAAALIATLSATRGLKWRNVYDITARWVANGALSKNGELLANALFDIMAAKGFGEGGKALTDLEWDVSTRSWGPVGTESDESWARKLENMNVEWKSQRNKATKPIWDRAVRGIIGYDTWFDEGEEAAPVPAAAPVATPAAPATRAAPATAGGKSGGREDLNKLW